MGTIYYPIFLTIACSALSISAFRTNPYIIPATARSSGVFASVITNTAVVRLLGKTVDPSGRSSGGLYRIFPRHRAGTLIRRDGDNSFDSMVPLMPAILCIYLCERKRGAME